MKAKTNPELEVAYEEMLKQQAEQYQQQLDATKPGETPTGMKQCQFKPEVFHPEWSTFDDDCRHPSKEITPKEQEMGKRFSFTRNLHKEFPASSSLAQQVTSYFSKN